MTPIIVNFDSEFDWTLEVQHIWEGLDWEGILRSVAPQISFESWINRRNDLALIGLVPSLVIEESYRTPHWEGEQDQPEGRDNQLLQDWRERQRRGSGRVPRFNGEEPFLRSPRVGRDGVVECYGIYVEDAHTILDLNGLLEKASSVKHSPAIFLCPERIFEIYPTILRLGEHLRHPLALSSNPALINLQMTLLHELRHHFFPVHRAGARQFLSEGLANLFCHYGSNQDQQAWLLYKSWYLQPPEYSAYRPLNVLCNADGDCRAAVAACFQGTLDGWVSLPKKDSHRLDRNIGASLNMALASDGAASNGLWWGELRQIVSEKNRWLLDWDGNHLFHHSRKQGDAHMPADLVLDLYRQNNLAQWATNEELHGGFWGGWANGDEVRWPDDCIQITEQDMEAWIEFYATSQDLRIATVICRKLARLLKQITPHDRPAVKPALERAVSVVTDDQAMWFDRVAAIEFIEACSDAGAIPALEAILAESEGAWDGGSDVREAVAKALVALRSVDVIG
jgi:hypothetical protein